MLVAEAGRVKVPEEVLLADCAVLITKGAAVPAEEEGSHLELVEL
jgi:hypothetical protein